MRLRALLTAVLVAIALYLGIFERALLREVAGVQSTQSEVEAEAAAPIRGAPSLVRVEVIDSTARDVDSAIALRGETEAARSVEVMAETSGRVIHPAPSDLAGGVMPPLRKGATVAEGDLLCAIDPGTRPAQLAEAQARLAETQVSDTAAARLAEGGFGSETRAATARAELQAAEAAVAAARTELDRLKIRAPFDGRLESDAAEIGSLLQPGTLCATVIDLDPMKIVGYLPQTAVDSVRLGAEATARLASGREVAGTVRFLARSADPSTRTFRVEIETPNPGGEIRDGQSADIRIRVDGTAAHLIPGSALTLDDTGTMGLRLVDGTDIVRFVPVRLLRDTPQGVLVTGLPDQARIIVTGQEFVTDGVRVTPVLRRAEGDT